MKIALRSCPICQCPEGEVLHRQVLLQPEGSPLPSEYEILSCPNCGFVYADSPAAQEEYDRYYADHSKYEDPTVATGGGASNEDRQRLELLADRITHQTSPTERILDIGCANGGLLAALQNRGYDSLFGVDAAQACVDQVRKLGITAYRLSLSRLMDIQCADLFDVIVLSHVMEHVVDLYSTMKSIVSMLAPGGRVYMETPDASRYKDFPFIPYYFFDSEHINHFNISSLTKLGAVHGLFKQASGTLNLVVGPDVLYPACWVWLSRETGYTASSGDYAVLSNSIGTYIEDCHKREQFAQLDFLAATGQPIIVWGAGSFAQRLFAGSQIGQCNIAAVVDRDRNKQSMKFAGFIVQSPEEALKNHPGAVIVIAAAIHGLAIAEEIERNWPEATKLVLSQTDR